MKIRAMARRIALDVGASKNQVEAALLCLQEQVYRAVVVHQGVFHIKGIGTFRYKPETDGVAPAGVVYVCGRWVDRARRARPPTVSFKMTKVVRARLNRFFANRDGVDVDNDGVLLPLA